MRKLVFVTLTVLIALPVFGQRFGFAAANQPSTVSYTPDPVGAYNSSGLINIKRLDIGLYRVTFEHLAKTPVKATNAQISDWGSGAEQCAVRSAMVAANTDNLVVHVQCISNATGANVDARYSVYVTVVP